MKIETLVNDGFRINSIAYGVIGDRTKKSPRFRRDDSFSVIGDCRWNSVSRRQLLLAGVAVFSLQGFDHQPLLDSPGADLDPLGATIHDRSDDLEIGLESPLAQCGHLQANAPEILGTTAIASRATDRGSFSREMADSWHRVNPSSEAKIDEPGSIGPGLVMASSWLRASLDGGTRLPPAASGACKARDLAGITG